METSSDEEDAVIPAIHSEGHQDLLLQYGNSVNKMGSGNLRPRLRARPSRSSVRGKTGSRQLTVEEVPSSTTLSVQDLSQSLDERRLHPAGGGNQRQVSLKDLCVEDKQRIANLIKELARVGEEREKAREDLQRERQSYEQQILKLVEQQEQILQERQEVEKHFIECQQLLAQSQQQQQQQQQQPPASLPAAPPPPPLPPSGVAPPPPASQVDWRHHPHWAGFAAQGQGGHDRHHHSLLGNVGSPHKGSHAQCAHSGLDGEMDVYRYQQEVLINAAPPTYPHIPPHHPPPPPQSHLHRHSQGSNSHHMAAGSRTPPQQLTNAVHHTGPPPQHPEHMQRQQKQQIQQQQQQQQPPTDFFSSALQRPEPLDLFAASKGTKETTPLVPPSQPNKEEVIQRFFASQTPEHDAADADLVCSRQKDACRSSRSKPLTRAAFPRPIMSSTQKSADIGDYLSVDSQQDYVPLVPDESSPRLWGDGDGGKQEGQAEVGKRGDVNRVAFVEGHHRQAQRLLSPVGDSGDNPTQAFRKMSQSERKEQLLQQRARLLEEQHRLKHILNEQENMLREKQFALNARACHQGEMPPANVAEDDDGGDGDDDDDDDDDDDNGRAVRGQSHDDPLGLIPQRLAIDAALERQRAIVDSLELEAEQRNSASMPGNGDRLPSNQQQTNRKRQKEEEEERAGSKVNGREGGGEPGRGQANKLSDVVRKLDYSLHSDNEEEPDGGDEDNAPEAKEEEEEEREKRAAEDEGQHRTSPPAQRQDAQTSTSYITIPRLSHSPMEKRNHGDAPFSVPGPPFPHEPLTPGEKTMAVLDIINSLQSPPSRQKTSAIHRHGDRLVSPFTQELSPSGFNHRELRPFSKWRDGDEDVEIVLIDSSLDDDLVEGNESKAGSDVEEDLEESQILEDIFFLK